MLLLVQNLKAKKIIFETPFYKLEKNPYREGLIEAFQFWLHMCKGTKVTIAPYS